MFPAGGKAARRPRRWPRAPRLRPAAFENGRSGRSAPPGDSRSSRSPSRTARCRISSGKEHGIEAAQADEMGRGNPKGPPGDEHRDAHDHEEPGGQAPGFLPDSGIRQGPGQAHPEPEVAAGPPEKHQQPQAPAESRDQVTRVWQESPPPFSVSGQWPVISKDGVLLPFSLVLW